MRTGTIFGRHYALAVAAILFGWISASHQVGAAAAAFFAGVSRTATGSYPESFVTAGFVAVAAALLCLGMRKPAPAAQAI